MVGKIRCGQERRHSCHANDKAMQDHKATPQAPPESTNLQPQPAVPVLTRQRAWADTPAQPTAAAAAAAVRKPHTRPPAVRTPCCCCSWLARRSRQHPHHQQQEAPRTQPAQTAAAAARSRRRQPCCQQQHHSQTGPRCILLLGWDSCTTCQPGPHTRQPQLVPLTLHTRHTRPAAAAAGRPLLPRTRTRRGWLAPAVLLLLRRRRSRRSLSCWALVCWARLGGCPPAGRGRAAQGRP